MDTFGERLRSSREKKGYSLEQVARDTNIARKYLNALEEEDFSIFPGEPYLIGFLKNYSDYLGLDSREIVTLHKNMRLQEQPVPIEELLDKGRPKILIIFLVILIAAAGAGGYFLFKYITTRPVQAQIETIEETIEPVIKYSYDITLVDIEDRFMEGTELQILIYEDTFDLSLKSVTTNVILSLPGGEIRFNLGDEKEIDLNGDGNSDVIITVNDIDINAKTAVIKMAAIKITVEDSSSDGNSKTPDPGVSKVASRNQNTSVILDASNPEPFVLDVIFRGYTLVRYLVDRGERVEQYFDKGETFRLDINREIMLWISNAGSFKAKISGIEINLGRPGEVSTHLIKWNKNSDSGKYELQMIPVY